MTSIVLHVAKWGLSGAFVSLAIYFAVLGFHVARQGGLEQRVFSYADNPNGYLALEIPWHMRALNWPHRIYQGGGRWKTSFGRSARPQQAAWPDDVGSPRGWSAWSWVAMGMAAYIGIGFVCGSSLCFAVRLRKVESDR